MSVEHVREKFDAAADALTSSWSLRERVLSAGLSVCLLRPAEFPDDVGRTKFAALQEMLQRHDQVSDEGTLKATVSRLSENELQRVAAAIFEIDAHYRQPFPD